MMLMLNVPATLGLLVLARPIVELLFEHGRFTAADTEATAAAAAVLRHRADRLFGGADRIADVLRAPAEPDWRSPSASPRSPETSMLSVSLVALMGFRGLALATVSRRASAMAVCWCCCCGGGWRESKATTADGRHGEDPRCRGADGGRRLGHRIRNDGPWCRAVRSSARGSGWRRRSAEGWPCSSLGAVAAVKDSTMPCESLEFDDREYRRIDVRRRDRSQRTTAAFRTSHRYESCSRGSLLS